MAKYAASGWRPPDSRSAAEGLGIVMGDSPDVVPAREVLSPARSTTVVHVVPTWAQRSEKR
jgi:hypothetical protein